MSDDKSVGLDLDWADWSGTDYFGRWAKFEIYEKARQLMRFIPPGHFLMGSPDNEKDRLESEGPQHRVIFDQGFWLFETPVTQELWWIVMGRNPSEFMGYFDRPVERVSWHDCQEFIWRLNVLKPGLSVRLPSEAEWEYACRAGTTTPFSFGQDINTNLVNYDGRSPYLTDEIGLYRGETVPVKSLFSDEKFLSMLLDKPVPAFNPWGLCEMHGNVYEWVQDAWHKNYEEAPLDGSAWDGNRDVAGCVFRGGSWQHPARMCRSAARHGYHLYKRSNYIGFRLARSV